MALVVMNVKNQQLRRTIYCFVIKHYTFLKYPISTAQKCIHWHVLLQAIIKINDGKVLRHTTKPQASTIANLQWKKLPNCYFLLQIYIFVWIWCISFLQLITVQNGLKMYAKCVRVWCAYLLTLIHSIHSFVCSFRPSVSMRNFLLCNTKRSNLRDEKLKRDIQRSAAKKMIFRLLLSHFIIIVSRFLWHSLHSSDFIFIIVWRICIQENMRHTSARKDVAGSLVSLFLSP